jgi:hypothetical protein
VNSAGQIDVCQYQTVGQGTIAGFPDVYCAYNLDVDENGDVTGGIYACGTMGELPGGCPIVYTLAPV